MPLARRNDYVFVAKATNHQQRFKPRAGHNNRREFCICIAAFAHLLEVEGHEIKQQVIWIKLRFLDIEIRDNRTATLQDLPAREEPASGNRISGKDS